MIIYIVKFKSVKFKKFMAPFTDDVKFMAPFTDVKFIACEIQQTPRVQCVTYL